MSRIVTVRIDSDDAILDLEEAIGTFAECLERSNVQEAFDNYHFASKTVVRYCWDITRS
jgi:hypothetical protein